MMTSPRAILCSGSYMLFTQHCRRPPAEVFARWQAITPNYSMRMSNVMAAYARPPLARRKLQVRLNVDKSGRSTPVTFRRRLGTLTKSINPEVADIATGCAIENKFHGRGPQMGPSL